MSQISHIVRQDLARLVPSSLVNDIVCFVFFDNHPKDKKKVDIVICTKSREIKEFYHRDLLSSACLDSVSTPSDIRILRNANCDLFYLVYAGDELFIFSRRDKLKMHRKVSNVDTYDIDDTVCRGQACLKVVQKDDAVPLIFDDNFECLGDRAVLFSNLHADDSLPILTQLMRKLTEAKYSVKCNEKIHEELLKLRQVSAFSAYQKLHPNLDDSVFKSGFKKMAAALKLETRTPWVKVCNEKIIIVLNIVNQNNESLEDIHILLHGTTRLSLIYTTKLFEKTKTRPFWRENPRNRLKCNHETAIIAVIALKEIERNVTRSIEFNGIISYKKDGKELLLPLDTVIISSLDTMGEEFDILSNIQKDELTILAVLATTEKTDLKLRQIRNQEDPNMSLIDIFCTHLQMERLQITDNIVIHRKSPYHTLNGTMVIFHDNAMEESNFTVSVHTRSPSQVLALIHYIYDAVPSKIIATTCNHKITAKNEELSAYNEKIIDSEAPSLNYVDYASSVLKRTSMILEHLDRSMITMNDSKNPVVQSKIGKEIDLFANGVSDYLKFRDDMLEEAKRGITVLLNNLSDAEPEEMIVD